MMRILSLTLILALLADEISAAASIRKVKRKSLSGSIQVIGVDADGSTVREVAAASWVAMPFGDCVSQCGSDDPTNTIAFRNRSVQCRSIQNDLLSDEACFGLRKPCAYQPCHCGISYCIPKDCQTKTIRNEIPARVAEAEAECAEELDDFDFVCLGCYRFSFGDSIGKPPSSPVDRTCVSWTSEKGTTCRSGLPFYRMRSNALTPSLCFEYCTGLGFDLFGLVQDSECRCGASELNQVIWSRANGTTRTYLKLPLPPPRTCEVPMDKCPVRVYRFRGHFESGGTIPGKLLKTYAGNSAYIDSIMLGHDSSNDEKEDLTGLASLLGSLQQGGAQPSHGLLETMQVPSWDRPCNDDPGCNAGPPWDQRVTAAPSGVQDVWQDYVIIKYKFNTTTDDARKEVFRAAASDWSSRTCILFEEQPWASTPYILVGAFNMGGCTATVGRPGTVNVFQPFVTHINLGWCNTMIQKGDVIHEIGHAIGMNHIQKRPDASETYNGKGPYIKIFWNNVDPQDFNYLPDDKSYTGSANDGVDDPQVGYFPYDFESIMHYGVGIIVNQDGTRLGPNMQTIPDGKYDNLLGSRQLSNGDITTVLDTYRCKRKQGMRTPSGGAPNPAPPVVVPSPLPVVVPSPPPVVSPSLPSTQVLPNSKLLTSSEIQRLVGFGLSSRERWNLCWRSSENGGQVSTFHLSCDNKGQSITVVSLKGDLKVGGYTTSSWGGNNKWLSSQSAWLFSISGQSFCKCETTMPDLSTFSSPNYGPTFGSGHDLATGWQSIGGVFAHCKAGSYQRCSGSCNSFSCGPGTGVPGSLQILDVEVYVAVRR